MTTRGPDARFAGRLAVIVQVLFAMLLSVVALLGGSSSAEPGFLPRPLILLAIYWMPAMVGYLGTVRSRPALLIAASISTFIGSFVAFSGVTLIFIVPSILFAVGAVSIEATAESGHREGIVGSVGRLVAAVLIAVLLVGAGASALLVTDTGCWNTYAGPGGPRFELLPYTNELSVPAGATSSGCSTGLISLRGVAIAVLLWGGSNRTGACLVAPPPRPDVA
jgi:hypothetical protein